MSEIDIIGLRDQISSELMKEYKRLESGKEYSYTTKVTIQCKWYTGAEGVISNIRRDNEDMSLKDEAITAFNKEIKMFCDKCDLYAKLFDMTEDYFFEHYVMN